MQAFLNRYETFRMGEGRVLKLPPDQGEGQQWRETPPDPQLKPDYSTRFQLAGYNRIQQELSYDFFKAWTGPSFPRVLLVEIQHPTPFYDDSYGVNSANNGPYGDAIQYELIPEIERRFRGIGEGWARFVYGGSTGGWIACPDPIDFRHYMTVNLAASGTGSAVRSTP